MKLRPRAGWNGSSGSGSMSEVTPADIQFPHRVFFPCPLHTHMLVDIQTYSPQPEVAQQTLIPSFTGLSSQCELSCPPVLLPPSPFSWPSSRCHDTIIQEYSSVGPCYSSRDASWNYKEPNCPWSFADSPSAALPATFPLPTGQEAEGQELRGKKSSVKLLVCYQHTCWLRWHNSDGVFTFHCALVANAIARLPRHRVDFPGALIH